MKPSRNQLEQLFLLAIKFVYIIMRWFPKTKVVVSNNALKYNSIFD